MNLCLLLSPSFSAVRRASQSSQVIPIISLQHFNDDLLAALHVVYFNSRGGFQEGEFSVHIPLAGWLTK